jgi:hypothetical protein
MNLRFRRLAPLALLVAAAACGGIADPTQGSENVATISGALTASSVPAGAHVALVWHEATTGHLVVGADVPIVDGHFTMTLAMPGDSFFSEEDSGSSGGSGGAAPPSTAVPEPAPAPSGASGGGSGAIPAPGLKTLSNASGQITDPMQVAIGGFVVWVDGNGNGQLDLEGTSASSPDDVIGGNAEIFLAYLRGGGQLDYEKLRDKSGILPAHGFNLVWSEGRWLPLDLVELKLTSSPALPSPVCDGAGGATRTATADFASGNATDTAAPTTVYDAGTYGGSYPSPGDPDVVCSPDGRSFYVNAQCPPAPPPGLCNVYETQGCAGGGGSSLQPDQPVPDGWPCPVTDADGGAADASDPPTDGGQADAGT